MSPVAYEWGTERPSQRIKRLRKLQLKQDEQIAKILRDVAHEIERLSQVKWACAREIEVLESILRKGRIDRTRAAQQKAFFDPSETPLPRRAQGRPRKHARASASALEIRDEAVGEPNPQATAAPLLKAENPPAVAHPRPSLGAEAAVEPPAHGSSIVRAVPPEQPVEAADTVDDGIMAIAALRALDLSGIETLPAQLLERFPCRDLPRAYAPGGMGDPEKVSYAALSIAEQERWIVQIGYKGVRARFDTEFKNRGFDPRYRNRYEAEAETLMARETALPLLLGVVANRIRVVLDHEDDILSGCFRPVQVVLSAHDTDELARLGPRTQETWWHLVDSLPWPKGLSRAEVMAFDGRDQLSSPGTFTVWDPTGKERDSQGVFIDENGAAKRLNATAEEERRDKARIQTLISRHKERMHKREDSKDLANLLIKYNRHDLLAEYVPHLAIPPPTSDEDAGSSDPLDPAEP